MRGIKVLPGFILPKKHRAASWHQEVPQQGVLIFPKDIVPLLRKAG